MSVSPSGYRPLPRTTQRLGGVRAAALALGLAFEPWLERGDVAAVAASVGAGG